MNLYFLVEGRRTERKIYPSWLSFLLPAHEQVQVQNYKDVTQNNYVLASGEGYPRLLTNQLEKSIEEVVEHGGFSYLVVVLDCDEQSPSEAILEVENAVAELNMPLGQCELKVIVQQCCIESWLLGNRRVFSPNPQSEELRTLINFFNVSDNNPEAMLKLESSEGSRSIFHEKYLKLMLQEKNIRYTKKNPRDTAEHHYLQRLIERIEQSPQDLVTFQEFIAFCQLVQSQS